MLRPCAPSAAMQPTTLTMTASASHVCGVLCAALSIALAAAACRSERRKELPPAPAPVSAPAAATYVGSERCSGCHAQTYAAWQTSHHRLAMQAPSDGSMLGDFRERFARGP